MLNQFAVEIPTLPVDHCHSQHIRYLKGCWGLHSYRRAAKKGRHAFGTHMVYRETFLQIHMHLHQLLILKNWILGVQQLRSRFICLQRRKVKDQNKIEILDASLDRQPKIQSSSVEETLQRIMGQTNNDCRFLDLHFDKIPYTSNVCLLEDKVQDRGMYLFTIPYGSNAMDQRSGVGWFSGWVEIFVIYSWYFNAEFWSTWCEDCFSTEQNHP